MIGVLQDQFAGSMEAQIPGNFIQAAIASVLELPLDAVPHFLLFGDWWGVALVRFLQSRGLALSTWTDREEWVTYWNELNVTSWPLVFAPADQIVIASGPSPRGDWLHVAVYRGGKLLHDPHPDGRGIAGDPVEVWATA